jgi:hypothetical protein
MRLEWQSSSNYTLAYSTLYWCGEGHCHWPYWPSVNFDEVARLYYTEGRCLVAFFTVQNRSKSHARRNLRVLLLEELLDGQHLPTCAVLPVV